MLTYKAFQVQNPVHSTHILMTIVVIFIFHNQSDYFFILLLVLDSKQISWPIRIQILVKTSHALITDSITAWGEKGGAPSHQRLMR